MSVEEKVWEFILEHASKGGAVNMKRLWRDCNSLPIDGEHVDTIIRKICGAGLIWMWNSEQIIVVRKWNCPNCGMKEERVSAHIDECMRLQRRQAQHRASLEQWLS